jgi:hypothetical protein
MSRRFAPCAALIPTALAGLLSWHAPVATGQPIALAEKHQRVAQLVPQVAGDWGLVLGADETVEKAMNEVRSARRTLAIEPAIFKCGSWFRTIVLLKDKNTALLYLSRARRYSRYKPYVVDMRSWCPSKQLVPTKG